jgi:hypothetical protein
MASLAICSGVMGTAGLSRVVSPLPVSAQVTIVLFIVVVAQKVDRNIESEALLQFASRLASADRQAPAT